MSSLAMSVRPSVRPSVCPSRKKPLATVLNMNLHWLPIMKGYQFKIMTLTYKALHGNASGVARVTGARGQS